MVYKPGPGPKDNGGQYFLYSGVSDRVEVPVQADTILVYHTPQRAPAPEPGRQNAS